MSGGGWTVELMEIRRGLMVQMAGEKLLWKTIVLDHDRISDSYANTVQWYAYLGIRERTDLDDYVYVALFSNNGATSYPADMIIWTNNKSGNVCYPSIRQDWSNGMGGTSVRSLFATAGTMIDVYRLPKYN
jgi:hypothetical protein